MPGPESPGELRPSITFIGGTKFDELALESRLRDLAPDTLVITGTGRGAEKLVRDLAPELGLELLELAPDQAHGPRTGAVNVEQILCAALGSPLVLVGGGGRVKQARSWLSRANWQRHVETIP